MKVYQLPDKRLVIPMRVEEGDARGDGMAVIDSTHPSYMKYMEFFNRTKTEPIQIESWPPPKTIHLEASG